MHMRVANFPAAILWIAASGCGLYLMVMMLQSAASVERVATLLTNFVTLPLVMLGGGFFPFEWMPRTLATIGEWTPNGWCVMQLRAVLVGFARAGVVRRSGRGSGGRVARVRCETFAGSHVERRSVSRFAAI